MEPKATSRRGRFSSFERLVAIILTVLAVLSPLYIDKRQANDPEPEEESAGLVFSLHFWIVLLILVMGLSFYCDQNFTRFDPYWIHRVGGSSVGITLILMILAFVLKCKA